MGRGPIRSLHRLQRLALGRAPLRVAAAAACLLLPSTAIALSSIDVLPTPASVASSSSHDLTFTTAVPIPDGGSIRIVYPGGFDPASTSLGGSSGFGSSVLVASVSDSVVTVGVSGVAVPAGALGLILDGVLHPTSAGSYTVEIETLDGGSATLEGPSVSSAFELSPLAPSALVLLPTSSALAAGDTLALRATAVDAHGNPSPPLTDQSLSLLASSATTGFFDRVGGVPIASLTLAADSSGVGFAVRDIDVSASPITVTVLDPAGGPPELGFDQTVISLSPAGVDADQSQASATTPVVADGVAASRLDLVLRDAWSNPVAGLDSALIDIVVGGPGDAVDELAASTDAAGSFAADLRSLDAGARSVTITADGVVLSDSPGLSFTPRPIDGSNSTLVAGGPAVADGVDPLPVDLTLRDGAGLAVSGIDSADVTIVVLDGPAAVDELDASSASDGAFAVRLRSVVAGSRRVTARVDGIALTDTVSVEFVAGPVSGTRSTASVVGVAIADGVDALPLSIELRDAFDNPVAGVDSSSIEISLPGVGWTVTELAAGSAVDGGFAAEIRSIVSGSHPVSITAAGISLAAMPTAPFVPGIPAAAASSYTNDGSAVADGTDVISVDVTVRDAQGNPVAGSDSSIVGIELTGVGHGIRKLAGATDSAGRLGVELTSTVAESKTLTVRVLGQLVGTPSVVDFVPGVLAQLVLTLPAASVDAGAWAALDVEARDAQGNTLVDHVGTVELYTDSAAPAGLLWQNGGGGSLVPAGIGRVAYTFVPTDSGTVSIGLRDTLAESLMLTVQDGPIQDNQPLLVIAASPQFLLVDSGDGQVGVAGSPLALPAVVLAQDDYGNPVSGRVVTFTASGDGIADTELATPGVQSTAITGVDGRASCEGWTLATAAGPQSLSAVSDFGPSVNLSATAGPAPPAVLALEPDGARDLEVGTGMLVAALLTDAYGNPVPGVDVTLLVTDALDGVLSGVGETDSLGAAQQRGPTGGDGRVRVSYTAPASSGLDDVLDATAAGFTPGDVTDLVISSIEAPAASIGLVLPPLATPAGVESSLTVDLLDGFDNPATGASADVEISSPPATGLGYSTLSGGPYASTLALNVAGSATVFFVGGPAGLHDVTVIDTGLVLAGDSGQLEVVASSIVDRLDLAHPASVVAGADFQLSIDAYDAYDNLTVDAFDAFTLDAVLAADTTVVATAPLAVSSGSLGGGVFVTDFQSYPVAEDLRLRANSGGRGHVGPILRVLPDAPWELVAVTPDTVTAVIAGDTVDMTVEVRDRFGNPVPGAAVDVFGVSGGSVQAPPPATDAAGRSTATLRTDAVVGEARLRLSILDATPMSRESRELVVLTRSGPIAALSVVPSSPSTIAGDPLAFSIEAVDAAGNVVLDATDNVSFAALGGGATVLPLDDDLIAGATGATLIATLVGSAQLEAWLTSTPTIRETSVPVSVLPAAAHRIEAVGPTALSAPSATTQPLRARVLDRFDNVVPGEATRLEIVAGPPDATLTDSAPPIDDGVGISDAAGLVDFVLGLSATTFDHQIRASIDDRNPAALESVEWTVTGTAGGPAAVELTLASPSLVAGTPTRLDLRLLDSAGNLVPAAGQVALTFVPVGAVAVPDPVDLVFGLGSVDVTAFAAGSLDVDASYLPQPSATGSLAAIPVAAAGASGVIPVPLVDPAVNTANGVAVTRILAGPVVDAWGNVVAEGTLIDVSADGGVLISEDADLGMPGLQRATDAGGEFDARLVAPLSPMTVTIDVAGGTASGTAQASFLLPASLAYDGGLNPAVAAPGQSLAFSADVRNDGAVDALLDAALSWIELDDGQAESYLAPLSADTLVPAGGSVTLAFDSQLLDPAFASGARTPRMVLVGQDAHGQPATASVLLPDGSLSVSDLAVVAVDHPTEAVIGDEVIVTVRLLNGGASMVTVTQLPVLSSPGGDFQTVSVDPLPVVAPGATVDHARRLRVGPGTAPGPYRFVARPSAEVGGVGFPVPPDSSATPLTVHAASDLIVVPGSVDPTRLSLGSDATLRMSLRNDGGAPVDLDPSRSYVRLVGGPVGWQAALSGPAAIAGGGTTSLTFGPVLLDPGVGGGLRDLELVVEGLEAGRPFANSWLLVGAVLVESSAALALADPPIQPSPTVRGLSVPFTVSVDNGGGATVVLDPIGTRLRLGEPGGSRLSALLDPTGPTALPPGRTELRFNPLPLPDDLVVADPVGSVELLGSENGNAFSQTLTLASGSLVLQSPAGLTVLSTQALNPRAPDVRVNAGQSIPLRVVVLNSGDEDVDDLTLSLSSTATPPSTAPSLIRPRLAAGEADTMLMDVSLSTGLGVESLIAEIVDASSATTGLPIAPQAPIDHVAPLSLQRPVLLAFEADLPDFGGVTSARVSPGQSFSLRVSLTRQPPLDQQGDWAAVQVDLIELGPFVVDAGESLPVVLSPSMPSRELVLHAPTQLGTWDVEARLARVDLDLNDPSATPLIGSSTASVQVEVGGGVAFDRCELAVIAPVGASDGVVSTGQLVVLSGTLDGPANLIQRRLQLLLPATAALVVGAETQDLPTGVTEVQWQVRMPDAPVDGLVLRTLATGLDQQSGDAVFDTCGLLLLDVVPAAWTSMNAEFVSPNSAVNQGHVPPSASLVVEAWLATTNATVATGPASIVMTPPAGFVLVNGAPEQQMSSVGERLSWELTAPAAPTDGIVDFSFELGQPPTDPNSGQAAGDVGVPRLLPISVRANPVNLAVGDRGGSGAIVSSSSFTERIELRLANGHAADIRWTQLVFELVDSDDGPLANAASIVDAVELAAEDGSASWTADVSTSAVVIDLNTPIPQDESRVFVLSARAAPGAAYAAFAFAFDQAAAATVRSDDGFAVPFSLSDLDGRLRMRLIAGRSTTAPMGLAESAHSYPNPFVPSRGDAILAYNLDADSSVDIEIFDLLGNAVRHWSFSAGDAQGAAGVHDGDLRWDGLNGRGERVRSGVYVCRMRAAGSETMFRIAVTR